MFDLDNIRVVAVTGPQRSGTTFTARAIASDHGWRYVDEAEFGVQNQRRWRALVDTAEQAVIQCPTMMRYVHDLPADVLVVVMRRDVDAIRRSENRIGWLDHRRELERYGLTEGDPARVKYDWWDRHKRDAPARWVEVAYESMSRHAMWVQPHLRRQFGPKQTSL